MVAYHSYAIKVLHLLTEGVTENKICELDGDAMNLWWGDYRTHIHASSLS